MLHSIYLTLSPKKVSPISDHQGIREELAQDQVFIVYISLRTKNVSSTPVSIFKNTEHSDMIQYYASHQDQEPKRIYTMSSKGKWSDVMFTLKVATELMTLF